MPQCPSCNSEGADILLTSVFCPNTTCRYYDELTKERLEKLAKGMVDGLIKKISNKERSESDVTPIWYPSFGIDDT